LSGPRRIAATVHRAGDAGAAPVLLVMLPGVGIKAREFVDHGFLAALGARQAAVDAVAADADADFYLEGTIVERLEGDILGPAREEGYRRLWFLGLSLGGMGALAYARAHPAAVEGIILLAPFLGVPGLIAEVRGAGGLAGWEPGAVAEDDRERAVLAWLARLGPAHPRLYLGYGAGDRFATGHALLGTVLPPERVVVSEGGHDWPTWAALWQAILERHPFGDVR